ncbi:MAG: AAA family ATPase [Candidatus Riflebacteria bacterium]|nr:AAA family ATPase [Candidatus Riflebacteria bacterium]
MRLLIAEALRDRRLDADDKEKIRALAGALNVGREEIEGQIRELTKSLPEPPSVRQFDPRAVFSAACDTASADGVLTTEEERLLFVFKEIIGLADDDYQKQIRELADRCRTSAGNDRVRETIDAEVVIDPASIKPAEIAEALIRNIEQVIIGKRSLIQLIVTAALANAHVLLEDVPGTGKTMLARSLAASIDCTCKRVQFTPDLLPMDITGTMIFNPPSGNFVFKRGPIFTNILLADEINRATPRTQSSLLEVMEERQVSIDGAGYPMSRIFFVIATQNPIEQHGTYPLPEAQLDRFLMKLSMGYPDRDAERRMLELHAQGSPLADIRPVTRMAEFAALQTFVRTRVKTSGEVMNYLLDLTRSLREHADLTLGPSPRASIALMRAASARACLDGRDFVIPDDVKALTGCVLAHRIVLRPQALIRKVRSDEIVEAVVKKIPVPVSREEPR